MADIATADDVKARLGRDLTASETTIVNAVLPAIIGLFSDATGKTVDDLEAGGYGRLKTIAVEKAAMIVNNPRGLASMSEQLGSAQRSETYPRASDIGIFLSDEEERQVREAVFGAGRGSARVPSLITDLYDVTFPNGPSGL